MLAVGVDGPRDERRLRAQRQRHRVERVVEGALGVVRDPVSGAFEVVDVDTVGADALVVHDAHRSDPSYAFGLSRLTDGGVLHRAPIGIFRDVDAPTYDDLAREQVALAAGRGSDDDALQAMVAGGDTWTVQ